MKHLSFFLVMGLLVILVYPTTHSKAAESPVKRGKNQKSLVFRVVDSKGRPLAGTKLTYLASPRPESWSTQGKLTAKTDENGEYVFQWDARHAFEQFEVLVEKSEHAPHLARWTFIAGDPLPETYTATLGEGFSVRWRVNGEPGDPDANEFDLLPDAKVSIEFPLKDRIGRDWKYTAEAVTGPDGRCVLTTLPVEFLGQRMEFIVQHPNYRQAKFPNTLARTKPDSEEDYGCSLNGLRLPEKKTTFPETVLLPELPRPDYGKIANSDSAPQIEKALEMMRLALNESNREADATNSEDHNWLFWQLTYIGDYVLFLQNAGLADDAQKLIDNPKFEVIPSSKNDPGLNLVEKVKVARSREGRPNVVWPVKERSIEELNLGSYVLNAMRTSEGFRYYMPPEHELIYPAIWGIRIDDPYATNERVPAQTIFFATLREMVDVYMKTAEVKSDDLTEVVKRVETNERRNYGSMLGYAVIFSALDRQEEADRVFGKACQFADRYLEESKSHDPPFTRGTVKSDMLKALIRMKRYEKAVLAMQEMKDYHDKLKAAGKSTSWHSAWDNPMQNMVRGLAFEGEIDLARRICREMFLDERSGQNGMKYLAQALAEIGRFNDAREINKLVSDPHNNDQWIDQMETARQHPVVTVTPVLTLRDSVLLLVEKQDSPAQKVQAIVQEVDKMLNSKASDQADDEKLALEFLKTAHRIAQDVPLNPGRVRFHRDTPPIEFRDEAVREIACLALYAGFSDETEEWLKECKALDAKLPNVDRRELQSFFRQQAPLMRDYPWIKFGRRFMKIGDENFKNALMCFEMIHDPEYRLISCRAILFVLLPPAQKKGNPS